MERVKLILFSLLIPAVLFPQESRSLQGAFGAVTIDGKIWNQVALRPVIPIGKFRLALDLVFYIDQDGNIHKDEWDFSTGTAIKNTLIDKIYYLRYGNRNDPLSFTIGALDDVHLGYGILVNGYSNAVLYPQVRKVGLDVQVKIRSYTVQGFINDFKENLGLVGLRVQAPITMGFPLGLSAVLDRNQYLGLRDRDGDGRPDLLDDFPEDDKYWLDSDGDGLADNHPLEWDVDGDNITDTLDQRIPGWTLDTVIVLDQDIQRRDEPLNLREDRDPVGGIAVDVGFPLLVERNMNVTVYAQAAQLIGETWDPEKSTNVGLGMGLIPVGVAGRFGPVRVNIEYRMIPNGRFEFAFWNRTYQVERASITAIESAGTGGLFGNTTVVTKEYRLGEYGSLKGYYASLDLAMGSLISLRAAYQNLFGERWDRQEQRFTGMTNQNISATLGLQRPISRLKTAQLFYQQRNVPNPFAFEFTESTVMGYRVGIELGSGIVLNYTLQRTFRDRNGDGDVLDPDETVTITAIETSFSF
jgi:hypothetical protein